MPQPKIDIDQLNRYLAEGKTQADIARLMGVSEAAVHKARKRHNIAITRNVALEHANDVVNRNLNAIEQLQKINRKANQLLDELTGEDKIIKRTVKAVQAALEYKDPKKQATYIKELVKKISGDNFLALKAMQEIRGQLNLQLDIFKTLYDFQAAAEFQQIVIDVIGEYDPKGRDEILRRLKNRRALRESVSEL